MYCEVCNSTEDLIRLAPESKNVNLVWEKGLNCLSPNSQNEVLVRLLLYYNINTICDYCFKEAIDLFKNNEEEFFEWLDENDNRLTGPSQRIVNLRSFFKVDTQLLQEDPNQYMAHLEKYAIYLESIITN